MNSTYMSSWLAGCYTQSFDWVLRPVTHLYGMGHGAAQVGSSVHEEPSANVKLVLLIVSSICSILGSHGRKPEEQPFSPLSVRVAGQFSLPGASSLDLTT